MSGHPQDCSKGLNHDSSRNTAKQTTWKEFKRKTSSFPVGADLESREREAGDSRW